MSGLSAPEELTPAPDGHPAERHYVGLVTRVISLAVDAAIINLVAIVVEVGAALILSLLHLPKDLKTVLIAIGGAAYILWTLAYFVAFWSTTGQTPGARVMQIRLVQSDGKRCKPRRAAMRCIGMVLAALPLFLGYAPILFDRRRRGFQDWLARTLVVEAPQLSLAAERRARKGPTLGVARSSVSGDDGNAAPLDPVSGREFRA